MPEGREANATGGTLDLVPTLEWPLSDTGKRNDSDRRFTPRAGSDFTWLVNRFGSDAELNGDVLVRMAWEGITLQPSITVPITSLRFPNKDEHLNPANIDHLIQRYEQNISQVHIFKDAIVVGSNVVRALLARDRTEVRVYIRENYPTEYPGDI
jgi:hypothetical protein